MIVASGLVVQKPDKTIQEGNCREEKRDSNKSLKPATAAKDSREEIQLAVIFRADPIYHLRVGKPTNLEPVEMRSLLVQQAESRKPISLQ